MVTRPATVLIYAKPPRMGLSKTRLATGLGPTHARRIAHFTLSRAIRAAMAEDGWKARLYTTPDSSLDETLGGIWPIELSRFSQGPGDLSDRLNKGLREAAIGPVIFIGADAPDVSAALLRKAIRTLHHADAVFGPASDGGFWLFGINKTARCHSPFENVRWSGPHAMEDVRSNLPCRTRVGELRTLIDIDEASDWATWRAQRHRRPRNHVA